jgi:predicted amidohydrolase
MSTGLTITLIQAELFWEDKKANLEMFGQKIRSITEKTHLVILPEMFNTGFSMNAENLAESMEGETVEWMREIAINKKIIVAGSLIIKENDEYFNRLVWMLPTGQYGTYDKRHLFAFAGEDKRFTAGKKRMIASVNGWKINLQVCYDLRFPAWARQRSSEFPEYDIILYVANWPERRIQAWNTLLKARAIENQCYVVGVNRVGEDGNGHMYSGESQVIDPLGEVLYQKNKEEDVFTITLERQHLENIREKFPFWKDADEFEIM